MDNLMSVFVLGIEFYYDDKKAFYFNKKIDYSFTKNVYTEYRSWLENDLNDFLKRKANG